MNKTLYLLRKPIHQIDPAVFLASESQGDVVLLEESGGETFSYAGGAVFSLTDDQGSHTLTYDDLVKKIFEHDHAMVI
jgi:hypothetical protein